MVAVGGDGTWSQVADRLVSSGESEVALGVLPAGTGNDFARSLGISYGGPGEAVAALAARKTRRIDVGRVVSPWRPAAGGSAGAGGDLSEAPRHFLNVVGFGFDVAVIDATAGARFLRGAALYKLTAMQQLPPLPERAAPPLQRGGLERRGSAPDPHHLERPDLRRRLPDRPGCESARRPARRLRHQRCLAARPSASLRPSGQGPPSRRTRGGGASGSCFHRSLRGGRALRGRRRRCTSPRPARCGSRPCRRRSRSSCREGLAARE